MREKEDQIPRREQPPRFSDLTLTPNRRAKDSPAKKTSKKIAQKGLTEASPSPIKDAFPDDSEDFDLPSISVTSDADFNGEVAESSVMQSTSSKTLARSELAHCSKITTGKINELIDFSKTGSAEEKIMVNLLNQSPLQAQNSVDMDDNSEEVLDALLKQTIDDITTLRQHIDKLQRLYLCCLLWIVLVLLFSIYPVVVCSFTGLPPT